MGFWKYCEEVTRLSGLRTTLDHIHAVHTCYQANVSVGQCADTIKELESDEIQSVTKK